jgi:hypothetical protein
MAQRLGDILLEQGAVDAEKLAAALSDQKAFGGKLGRTLVDLGYVTERELLRALAAQLELQTVDLDVAEPTDDTLSTLTVDLCERYGVFPVKFDPEQRVLWLATAEPDHMALQEVAQTTQLTLEPMLAPMSQIESAVRKHYFGERAGEVRRRKGDALTAIPMDSGLPVPKKPPPGKLPSSADAVLHDPDAPPPPPEPAPPPAAAPHEEEGEPIVLEPTAIVPSTLKPEDTPVEKPAPAPAPVAPPAPEVAPPPSTPPPVEPADNSFAAFAQQEPAGPLRTITPQQGALDAMAELQRLVLRQEKIIAAQGRAFRALIEILQEKGVVRRGELGSRTTKKP